MFLSRFEPMTKATVAAILNHQTIYNFINQRRYKTLLNYISSFPNLINPNPFFFKPKSLILRKEKREQSFERMIKETNYPFNEQRERMLNLWVKEVKHRLMENMLVEKGFGTKRGFSIYCLQMTMITISIFFFF